MFHWWLASEPACGEATRFWCTCTAAAVAFGHPWPVCWKLTTTSPALRVMLTEVITTAAVQSLGELLADDESLSELLCVADEVPPFPLTAPAT